MTGTKAAPPFFIVGFQRSGTTLLRLMLDNHPGLAVPLDTVGLWAAYAARVDKDYSGLRSREAIVALVDDILREHRVKLWDAALTREQVLGFLTEPTYSCVVAAFYQAYASAKGKARWGDKDPGNMRRIDMILEWFPQAQILHIVRDGRDCCLSHLEQDFGHSSLLPCAVAWREEVEWVRRIGRILGRQYLEIRYEDLVREPERVLQRVTSFLQVDYHPTMLNYHRKVSESVPTSKLHIWPMLTQRPQAAHVERWRSKMSRGDQVCFEKRAGAQLKALGYPTVGGPDPSGAYWSEGKALVTLGLQAIRRRLGQ